MYLILIKKISFILFLSRFSYLISVGLENGSVEFYLWNPIDGFTKYTSIESRFCHHATVKRLSFRKTFDENGGKKQFYLASCSEDNSVRLFRVEA